MAGAWKFIKAHQVTPEQVFGRHHDWYFHPEFTTVADTLMVKVNVPPGKGHHFHRHPEMNEILYILSGVAEQWVEHDMQMLGPGDAVYIDPNVVHATFNAGNDPLVFLAILAPLSGWAAGTIDEFENEPYASYRSKN